MIELDRTEAQNINGGGEIWRKTGLWIGAVIDLLEDVYVAYSGTPEGQACQQALQDFH